MDASVIIPTFGRPEQVAACLVGLVEQTLDPDRYEVLVGIDGAEERPDQARATARALHTLWPTERSDRLTVIPCPKVGQASVRNTLLARARGETLVFLNDDMLPTPTLLAEHVDAQRAAVARGATALVVGAAPWVVHEPDSLFDRLIRETSMVFFYDQMNAALEAGEADPLHNWGFRHAWLLNLSAPARLVRDVGGFTVFPSTYGYEDDELAFRCREYAGTPVHYQPRAVAHHDHALSPDGYLAREYTLGRAAWGFARTTPACALAMFGRDVTDRDELTYSRAFVERERSAADRSRATLRELAETPADAVPHRRSPAASAVLDALYQQHLPLKRWEWRRGLLDASAQHATPEACVASSV